jgi:hypothetical protein
MSAVSLILMMTEMMMTLIGAAVQHCVLHTEYFGFIRSLPNMTTYPKAQQELD